MKKGEKTAVDLNRNVAILTYSLIFTLNEKIGDLLNNVSKPWGLEEKKNYVFIFLINLMVTFALNMTFAENVFMNI